MYKETCKTTKFINFMTIQYHSGTIILFLSHSTHSAKYQFPAHRLFLIIQLIRAIPELFP